MKKKAAAAKKSKAKKPSARSKVKAKPKIQAQSKKSLLNKKKPKDIKDSVPHSSFIHKESEDKAHSPGHRKLNVKDSFVENGGHVKSYQQEAAVNNMSNSNRMRRHTSAQRRVITGAAIGKTGRITPVK
jgi:hypothetical protein